MFSLSNVFRIFFFALSLAGLLLFVIPAVGFRIFNIGNVTAILVFELLIVYQLKMSAIHAFLAKLWLRPAGKTLLFVLTVCVAAAIGLVMADTAMKASAVNITCYMTPSIGTSHSNEVILGISGDASAVKAAVLEARQIGLELLIGMGSYPNIPGAPYL